MLIIILIIFSVLFCINPIKNCLSCCLKMIIRQTANRELSVPITKCNLTIHIFSSFEGEIIRTRS